MRLLPTRKSSYLVLSLFVLVADQWSKWWAELYLTPHVPKTVIPRFLNFTLVENTGVAFGMFAAQGKASVTLLLTVLGLAALTLVGFYFGKTPLRDKAMLVALALIMGGAVGNLLDRIATGSVTDFIDAYVGTYHWHTFNIADSAITIGICLMALEIFIGGKKSPQTKPAD